MIEVQSITKMYGSFAAARDVAFTVPRGQVVGILGPNGAGKSTTIRIIAGLLPPTAGRVLVDGLDSIAQTRQVRRRLGYLPESNPLYPEMLVRDFLRYRAKLFNIPARDRRKAIAHAADRCALQEVMRKRISALSKGFRQRVGLAAALIHDPPLLILDEPTSGLDPAQIAETRRLIRELAGQRTMLLVSHLLPEVERTCDRVIVFARGRVRADGPPKELVDRLFADAPCLVEVGGTTAAGVRAALAPLATAANIDIESEGTDGTVRARLTTRTGQARGGPDASTSETLRIAVGRALQAANLYIRELRTDAPSLETLYISLIEQAESSHQATAPPPPEGVAP